MTTSDICERARIAYDLGIDPIDYAETELGVLIGVHLRLTSMCIDLGVDAPEGTLTVGAMARRILGSLLDAGWKAPEVAK
jgi:hypothetical protein